MGAWAAVTQVICKHGLTIEGDTTREQQHDLIGGSWPRLLHMILCLKGERGSGARLRRILLRQAVARLVVRANMHQDDAKRRIEQLTGARVTYGDRR